MRINSINFYNYQKPVNNRNNTSFKQLYPINTRDVERLTYKNIGMMPNGIIGKVLVKERNGVEGFLNVIKEAYGNSEIYILKDMFGAIYGEMELTIPKQGIFSRITRNPNAVFVELLQNYTRPYNENHNNYIAECSKVGTRLLQIAQRRSDECGAQGNVELFSLDDALPYYLGIGFKLKASEFYENRNMMYLPPESKEPFSKLYGGL
ncbi:MAG: GNAT family N-acetyltransferase [bacterium]|nr:GNAT family N-acetyltransferase [bacterium]